MSNIKEYFSVIDANNRVYGQMQFETVEEAQKALEEAKQINPNMKIIKESDWD